MREAHIICSDVYDFLVARVHRHTLQLSDTLLCRGSALHNASVLHKILELTAQLAICQHCSVLMVIAQLLRLCTVSHMAALTSTLRTVVRVVHQMLYAGSDVYDSHVVRGNLWNHLLKIIGLCRLVLHTLRSGFMYICSCVNATCILYV